MLKGYVTNLGKYNEGYLIGKWVSFPMSAEDFADVLESIGINEQYEEWFVTDYETDINGFDLGEYESLETLNEVAEVMDGLDDYESEAFEAMLDNGYSRDEALEKVQNGDYIFYADCEDMTDVAMQYAEDTGLLDSMPDNLRNYFDFAAFGRDMGFEGQFAFINNDCIEIL